MKDLQREECKNCKDWADSYKRKVPCDICKDKRYVFGPGYEYCKKCRGTGKGTEQLAKEDAEFDAWGKAYLKAKEDEKWKVIEEKGKALYEAEEKRKEEFLKNVVIIGNLEVMGKDLGMMNWDDAVSECKSFGDDWRLPNINELIVLCKNKHKIGGFKENCYWSSSEGSSYQEKNYGIPTGNYPKYGMRVCFFSEKYNSEEECDKKIYQGVRAVRSKKKY
jgi:hypothetical protein